MGKIHCDSGCFLKGKSCKEKRACACGCGPLKSLNPNLYDGCVDLCQENPDLTKDEYLCKVVGGASLFEYYGIESCGFQSKDSVQFQSFDKTIKFALFGFLVVALVLTIIFFLFKPSK